MDDVALPRVIPASSGTVVMMLSLNLILLALFILLNAFAKPSTTKAEAALEGVEEGFDYRESGLGVGSDQTQMLAVPWQMNLQEGLNGLVHNQLLLEGDAVEADASMVRVVLPVAVLFGEGQSLLPARVGFVENVAALLAPAGAAPEGTLQVAVVAPVEEVDAAVARARALASVLAPVVGAVLTVAVREGQESQVVMEFVYTGAGNSAGRIGEAAQQAGGVVKGVAP